MTVWFENLAEGVCRKTSFFIFHLSLIEKSFVFVGKRNSEGKFEWVQNPNYLEIGPKLGSKLRRTGPDFFHRLKFVSVLSLGQSFLFSQLLVCSCWNQRRINLFSSFIIFLLLNMPRGILAGQEDFNNASYLHSVSSYQTDCRWLLRGWITKHVAKYGTKLPTNWELLKGGDWSLEKWLWSVALSPLCR